MINNLVSYFNPDGTPTAEGLKFFRSMEERIEALGAAADIAQAERVVLSTYGDRVSVEQKAKSLLKFGRNDDLDAGTRETIWNQGGDETYVAFDGSNPIDSISSSDAGDTQEVSIEYHTQSGTGASTQFTFGTQTATLNGQTRVALTAGARVSRVQNLDNTPFAGDVHVYENTALSGGVPSDATKIHAKANAGDDQTFKTATTFSNSDYAFISHVYASVKRSTSAVCDFRLEVRSPGGVFLPKFEFSVSQSSGVANIPLSPFIIVPKNNDVRITAESNTNNTTADAGFGAYLAAVV